MTSIQKEINDFKESAKERYPNLHIDSSYDDQEDYYHIWHTNSKLQFEDEDFLVFIGKLIKDCLYSKGIFNFSFSYNYLEDQKTNLVYQVKPSFNDIILSVERLLLSTQDSNNYNLVKHFDSLNFTNLDSVNFNFDAKDLYYDYQLLRQADTKELWQEREDLVA